ncbi:MAG TPA: Ku protein [Longimicrobiales bacterium]|nr:Ku protein [Longimicrobiales bacterium]
MAPRPIATASISFGLVTVPIQMYSASETSGSVSFNWIHKDCGSRLKQQYICQREGVKVERDEMIKGYEFAKDQYVLFSPDELKALDEVGTNTIEITEFVPADKVKRVYIDRPYYLAPGKGGDRAYRLLAEAMKQTNLSAIGRYAARGKQYLIMLSPMEDGMVMEQLHYADEVRPMSEVPIPAGEVKENELKLAINLVEQLKTDEFHPENYRDEVRDRVLDLITQKIEGQDITSAPEEAPAAQIIDLMAALKASLEKVDTPTAKPKASKSAKKAGKKKTGTD